VPIINKELKMTILRMPQVKEVTGHRSHASIYSAIKNGLFTKGILIGQRAKGWPADEVAAINKARIAGYSNSEIRELVKRLHMLRVRSSSSLELENCSQELRG
jgi:prophage regulatory protein